ncbi:hypothetical protein QAD02_001210 [Eretmocerus hayati]|uniref:Uncharacterized protein n=1 Tax=Eretmocerus hayati TaxID=131215 RepID=A0ACC2NFV3_9HYME|nr:hypothetical protein QAD02_001210 [Eretmocerus hayati]
MKKCRVKILEIQEIEETAKLTTQNPFIKNFELGHLNEKKAVVKVSLNFDRWLHTKVIIINMADCSMIKLRFIEDTKKSSLQSNMIFSGSYFEFLSTDIGLCKSKNCRLKYDENGRRIGLPKNFESNLNQVQITRVVNKGEFSDSIFALGLDDEKSYKLTHVNRLGEKSFLDEFPIPEVDRSDQKIGRPLAPFRIFKRMIQASRLINRRFWSNSYNKYGLCSTTLLKNNIRCVQYDTDKNMLFDETFKLSENEILFGVYNLKEDGILLILSQCNRSTNEPLYTCENFQIMKATRDEYQLKKKVNVVNEAFTCNLQQKNSQISVAEVDKELCVYVSCLHGYNISDTEHSLGFDSRSACMPKLVFGLSD